MPADLTPDVRVEAARAADTAHLEGDVYDGWARWLAVVDAVTAEVAEEIERPLQARIEELEAKVPSLACPRDCEPRCEWAGVTEGELIQHYIDVHHSPTQDAYDSVTKAYWKRVARVEELEAQRAELLERCRQADLSKALPDLSTGEVRRALGIAPLGGPDA